MSTKPTTAHKQAHLCIVCDISFLPEEEGHGEELFAEHILEQFDTDGDEALDIGEFRNWYNLLIPDSEEEEDGHNHKKRKRDTLETYKDLVADISVKDYFTRQVAPEEAEEIHTCESPEHLFEEADENADFLLKDLEIDHAGKSLLLMILNECGIPIATSDSDCSEEAWIAWLGGFASTIIVSIIALCAVAILPLTSSRFRRFLPNVLSFLVAFAVGALVGDALLHILPEVLELHSHESESATEDAHAHEEETADDALEYVGVMSVVILGILAFFLMEKILYMITKTRHSHATTEVPPDTSVVVSKTPSDDCDTCSTQSASSGSEDEGDIEMDAQPSAKAQVPKKKWYRRHPKITILKEMQRLRVAKPFAWLNLMADTIHNLIDGIAIGAAYSSSLSIGIATSLAVFFHEVPQELGDFAIIISAGFSKKMALLFNFLSAVVSIIGMMFGLGLGSSPDTEKWLLSFTAGGFLYIAMADMLPEINHAKPSVLTTVIQLFGLVLGFSMMYFLLLLEEAIGSESC